MHEANKLKSWAVPKSNSNDDCRNGPKLGPKQSRYYTIKLPEECTPPKGQLRLSQMHARINEVRI